MTRLAQDDIRARNRAGLAVTVVDDGIDNSAVYNSEPVTITTDFGTYTSVPGKVAPITKAMDLDAAYARYKAGKGFGRSDLFIVIIDEIKALKARIGAVDEAKVAELDGRMSALERTLGNAIAGTAEKRGAGRPKKEPTE